ncbi:MAG: winged helix DNA-binding domain-containing protein [Synergistaceae bacterium]|nr:winged helix DNA-binding domain-containing protein [Synergistaceae bacterium]
MTKIVLTKSQARRYLIAYHSLKDETCLDSDDAIVDYIRKVGCIQFDPLDVVGRNPDLVLQARCARYKKGGVEKLLYREKRLFDVWDKKMSICSVDDWPYFSRFRESFRPYLRKFARAVEFITGYLREHECACSSDFEMEEKVDWHYGPQRLAKAALECMCYSGLAVVHHKKKARRYYCLAENFISERLLSAPDPNRTEEEYHEWFVLRRLNGVGLLWNRGIGGVWGSNVGFRNEEFRSPHRNKTFEALLRKKKIVELEIGAIPYLFYLDREKLPLLETSIESAVPENNARFLAPLDNLLWDRYLISAIFDFDYKWEVYVPPSQRKYGYYVLPVLCGESFVGRTEMRVEKENRLTVQSFWWEDDVTVKRKYAGSLKKAFQRFAEYNLCGGPVTMPSTGT